MKVFRTFVFLIHLSKMVNAIKVNPMNTHESESGQQRKPMDTIARKLLTGVVADTFCKSDMPLEDVLGNKNTLKEVHNYAELKYDHYGRLPDSFTICSSLIIPSCGKLIWPTFFTILGNDGAQFLAPVVKRGSIVSLFRILYVRGSSKMVIGRVPPIFPDQWTRSCMAVNATSGSIQWVVGGNHVLSTTSEEVKSLKSKPKDLTKRVILGARSYAGDWSAPSHRVTNLNIYSTTLSREEMKSMTRGDICAEKGDYLAWEDMEWILHGQERIENVDREETCKGEPYADFYYTNFPSWATCMNHCKNLGTRVPPVNTHRDWAILQSFLKMSLYEKGLDTLRLWLPVADNEIEGVWRDFYSGDTMRNITPPWAGSKPDGGVAQNCAYLRGENTWGDIACNYPKYACMCTHDPNFHLELKGLCPGSSVDVHYKPISDLADSRILRFQGLQGTSITYNRGDQIWTLFKADTDVSGESGATQASFTLGKHNWTIEGDKGCHRGQPYVTALKMSGCKKGNFTCNDGQCVNIDLRCNQLPDCRDKSDERNCEILVLEDGYNKLIPPLISSKPVEVSVSIDLSKLVDIDEVD